MVRQNRGKKIIEFYVGTNADGCKIPIPFENILITGRIGSGKSTFVHNLIQDALIRYNSKQIEFRIWDRDSMEYSIWDVEKVTEDRPRTIPNVKITANREIEDRDESFIQFLKDAADVCSARHAHLQDYRINDAWDYNSHDSEDCGPMVPIVFVIDAWDWNLPKGAKTYLERIFELSGSAGVMLIWIGQSAITLDDEFGGNFCNRFNTKIVYQCSSENSEKLLGSNYCTNNTNPGVGKKECVLKYRNMPLLPLDVPKFSYSLGKKIARALSQEKIM